ncbi:ectoine synthase [Actinomarinicola tropica]|uniref:L-ectoine synthase n=1 Tax=Actinomarinicola tropica TaxID=2789776 RepID=A0A5Q2RL22_9ACTN|nr:ectoine synthase [Actinomarinicola tropica]QGG96533.1 L-ectoine synthase [Actinomarinicola tropica]
MIVRRLDEISGTNRDVEGPTFVSRRFLLADDQVGFSLHDTVLYAGTVTNMWYRNHIEAVYCIEGHATLQDLDNDETHDIRPGTLYTLNGHERHTLTVHEDVRMVCVFNPPLTGGELHDDEGTYPLLTAEGAPS